MKKILITSMLSFLCVNVFAEVQTVDSLTQEELIQEKARNEEDKALKYKLFESDVKESITFNDKMYDSNLEDIRKAILKNKQ